MLAHTLDAWLAPLRSIRIERTTVSPTERDVSVTRLSVPLQTVGLLLGAAFSMFISAYAAVATVTRPMIESQKELEKAQGELRLIVESNNRTNDVYREVQTREMNDLKARLLAVEAAAQRMQYLSAYVAGGQRPPATPEPPKE